MSKWKNHFGEWYTPHESFMLRTPLFPIEYFFNLQPDNGNDIFSEKKVLSDSLRQFYFNPLAQEALYVGSPDLFSQMKLWLEDKIENTEKREKCELALLKYMIRSCTRCTPYGLFASCSAGKIAGKTEIALKGQHQLKRHGRLDMDYVCQVHTHVLKQKEIRDQLLFFPNTSIYSLGDQLRYIEYRFQEEKGRSYHLVQVEQSEYVERVLSKAGDGAYPATLAQVITDDEISVEEAREFIDELINSQLLVSELEPNVTGEEYFSLMLRKLKTLQHTEEYVGRFEQVIQEFKDLANEDQEDRSKIYQQIVGHLEPLEIPLHVKTLIQVDSLRPVEACTINKKISEEVLSGSSLLYALSPASNVKDAFTDFKNAFRSRYDDQWVPLVEVLDTESGIGYGKFATSGLEESPLIDQLPIGNGHGEMNGRQISDAESFKWQLYQEAVTQDKIEVRIDDKVFGQLPEQDFKPEYMPDSIFTMIKVYASTAAEIDRGQYKIALQSPSGPSGGNLMGRFCHLHPEFVDMVSTVLHEEEAHHPECIFAEIVHLPESRIGNILMRPVLRQYEIPYLCGTRLDREHQIPVTDLLVGIENDQVILRSGRLGKRIIPRMTTAHNFSMTTLPVYQFLCDLQYQHIRHVGWQWGILENRPFLPRVTYGKYIFSKAQWLLTKDDFKECVQKNDQENLASFQAIAKRKNLPEYILLTQGDNELTLHLKNINCIRLLLQEIQKAGGVIVTETLDIPGQCWITSPDGHHAGEFILTFGKKVKAQSNNSIVQPIIEKTEIPTRIFPVGSPWLYAKIYCGTKTAEKILIEKIKPFTEELLAEGKLEKYFFIRYHDTGNHIRVRFYNEHHADFWQEIISRLQEMLHPMMLNHTVSNLVFETYQREVERYGTDTIVCSEDIFFHQSETILQFLSMLAGDEGEQYRWQVAFKAIDLILDQFGYSPEQKRDLIRDLQKAYSSEFGIEPPVQRKIAERFYNNRLQIQHLMNDEMSDDENAQIGIDVFRNISSSYLAAIEQLKNAPSVQRDIIALNRLMPSYLHMFINRMFVSNQRKVELVLYSHLLKYYDSQIAIVKNKKEQLIEEEIKVES